MKPLVIVCSPDAGFYLIISYILKSDGFDCVPAGDCVRVAEILSQQPVAVILLHCDDTVLGTPEHINRIHDDGIKHSVPVVALLPLGRESLYLDLLNIGIEQIFVSPYAPERLLEALHAITGKDEQPSCGQEVVESAFSVGKLHLFPNRHQVQYDGQEIMLRPIQFKLLAVMMVEPGRIFSREQLIEAAWARNIHVEPRTVDVHIGRLRAALRAVAGQDLIRTVRSAGYGLDAAKDKNSGR
jgi:two-component system, OmpR family, phosphate regulon response regulator PhoB